MYAIKPNFKPTKCFCCSLGLDKLMSPCSTECVTSIFGAHCGTIFTPLKMYNYCYSNNVTKPEHCLQLCLEQYVFI